MLNTTWLDSKCWKCFSVKERESHRERVGGEKRKRESKREGEGGRDGE